MIEDILLGFLEFFLQPIAKVLSNMYMKLHLHKKISLTFLFLSGRVLCVIEPSMIQVLYVIQMVLWLMSTVPRTNTFVPFQANFSVLDGQDDTCSVWLWSVFVIHDCFMFLLCIISYYDAWLCCMIVTCGCDVWMVHTHNCD